MFNLEIKNLVNFFKFLFNILKVRIKKINVINSNTSFLNSKPFEFKFLFFLVSNG